MFAQCELNRNLPHLWTRHVWSIYLLQWLQKKRLAFLCRCQQFFHVFPQWMACTSLAAWIFQRKKSWLQINKWWFPELGVPPNHPVSWDFRYSSIDLALFRLCRCRKGLGQPSLPARLLRRRQRLGSRRQGMLHLNNCTKMCEIDEHILKYSIEMYWDIEGINIIQYPGPMTLDDLDRSPGPTLVEIRTSEGNLVEFDGLQGKGKAVGPGLGQQVESCDYWSTWCYIEAAAKVDRLHQRLWREWPGRPLVRSKMYITEATQEEMVQCSCAYLHGSNGPEFTPEDSNTGNCIVSVKKMALKRPESFDGLFNFDSRFT